MIRPCQRQDIDTIYEVINDSARAYRSIPERQVETSVVLADERYWRGTLA